MTLPSLGIDPALSGTVRLAAFAVEGLAIDDGAGLWSGLFDPLCRELHVRYGGATISHVPGIEAARQLYKAIGVDPTRWRPASEALIRRVIKGKELYRVNSLVDTINYCSLYYLLPLGLFDLDRIEGGSITLRLGLPGESFGGIRKDAINVAGRYTLADSAGPFGSPTADSERTSIRPDTRRALVVLYAPAGLERQTLLGRAVFTAEMVERHGGGSPRCSAAVIAE
ncbi:hypothetical protein LLH00_11235 [bacterium]|nr:hypothetical protein [bacterium]